MRTSAAAQLLYYKAIDHVLQTVVSVAECDPSLDVHNICVINGWYYGTRLYAGQTIPLLTHNWVDIAGE